MIQITDNLCLKANKHSWILLKLRGRTRNGKMTKEWESFKWFTSLEGAINGCVNHLLMISDADTLDKVLDEHKKIHTKLLQAIPPKYKITLDKSTNLEDKELEHG